MTRSGVVSQFRKVTHCIFDLDGLLLDTETIYEEIVRRIAKAFCKSYPQEVRIKLMGTTVQKSAHVAVNDLQLPITVDEYLKRYYKLCGELLGDSPLMQGAERLLRHLHAYKVPLGLATSSSSDSFDLKTKNYRDLFKLFEVIVCGSTDPEVKEGKPNPDIFLVAASRFADKPEPVNCLVFEDSPNGVTGATAAGMQSIMVPDERIPAEMRAQATLVLKSLNDFKPEQFGLPSFSDGSGEQC